MVAQLHRRLSRIEGLLAPEIHEDQCDPALVEFFQTFAGGQFKDAAVSLGVSCGEFVAWLLEAASGTGFKPVKLPAG